MVEAHLKERYVNMWGKQEAGVAEIARKNHMIVAQG